MRTLKKALSLVLVLAMVLSLGVTAFAVDKASDYSDYSTVTSKEAVDVLTAIGVLNGNTDGSFGPTGNFTRAQAATIIAHMMLGTKTASAVPQVATKFNDVSAAHWASGYINYCVDNGIINGYGDGRFGPEDTLTATQWALMLLNALGYNPKYEGIGGAGWEIKTTTLAVSAEVADAEQLTGTFNRDVAAAMALNTLKATLVEYNDNGLNIDVSTGDSHVVITGNAPKATPVTSTVGYEKNINDTKTFTNSNVQRYTVEFGEKYFSNLKLNSKDTDAFERPANTWELSSKEIGSYAQKPILEYTTTVTVGSLYKDLKLGKNLSYNADPDENTAVKFYVDGDAGVDADCGGVDLVKANGYLNIERNAPSTAKLGGNGVLTQVFAIERVEGGVNYVEYTVTCINSYVGDVTSKVAASGNRAAYVTIAPRSGLGGKFETTEFSVDDVVVFTYSEKTEGTTHLGVQSAVKAEIATGELTKVNANVNAVVDGKTYAFSKNIANKVDAGALKTAVDVVLDTYGYAIDFKSVSSKTQYAVVARYKDNADYWNDVAVATLVLTDGTIVDQALLTAKDGNGDKVEAGSFAAGDIVSYKVNSSDKYTLTKVASVNTRNDVEGTQATFTVKNGEYTIDSILGLSDVLANGSTIFVVKTENGDGEAVFNAYNGIKNVPTIKTKTDKADATVYCKEGKVATVVYLDAAGSSVSTSGDNLIYVSYNKDAQPFYEAGVGNYYEVTAVVNGELKEDFKVSEETWEDVAGGTRMFDNASYTTSGIATLSNSDAENCTGIKKVSNDVLGFGSANKAYVVSDKITVWYKDTNGVLSLSSVSAVADDSTDNVYYYVNSSKRVTCVVIEQVNSDENDITADGAVVYVNGKKVDTESASATGITIPASVEVKKGDKITIAPIVSDMAKASAVVKADKSASYIVKGTETTGDTVVYEVVVTSESGIVADAVEFTVTLNATVAP